MKPRCWLAGITTLAGTFAAVVVSGENPRITTTVFVNRHFEVRDHDQPVKYVFNGDTRVARVTGSFSANARLQRLRLQAGWNLVSLAVTAADFLGQLEQFADGPSPLTLALYRWQPATTNYAPVTAGQTVAAGSILWLRVRTNKIVAVRGDYAEPTSPALPANGGFVASAGLEAWPQTWPAGVTIWMFNTAARRWQAGFTGDLAPVSDAPPTLAPGDAIYVHTTQPVELELPEPAGRVLFYHPDHLGSSTAVTDASGSQARETAFHPFGATRHEERLRQIEAHYGFTQKERDPENGLQYFGHRFLSATLGRWISTDPLLEKGGGPNPYAYANQSPLKHHDPDGAEITVVKGYDNKTRTTTYDIKMQAVLIDVSSKKFTQQELAAYATKLKSTIEKSFSGKEGKTTWTTTVNLRVINDRAQIGECDHVFRILDNTRSHAAGSAKVGGKLMDIAASTLRMPNPDQVDRSLPGNKNYTWEHYTSPEGTGTHEFGHSGGLDHVHGEPNLMQRGNERKFDTTVVTLKQIETMHKAFKAGKLNQREEMLDEFTRKR